MTMMADGITSFDVLLFDPGGIVGGTEISKPKGIAVGVFVDGVGVLIICGRQHY